MNDLKKLEIIKQIEEKAIKLKSPKLSKENQLKIDQFEKYKIAYQNIKLQDPSFVINDLEIKKEPKKEFKLEDWVLNHYTNITTNNNTNNDIKI